MQDVDKSMNGQPKKPRQKIYEACIQAQSTDRFGLRVSVLADSLSEARTLLEAEHGKGTVFDLHNPEDAARIR